MEPEKTTIPPQKTKVFEKNERFPHGSGQLVKSDFEVWQRFKKGDKAAFIFIYQKFFPVLYSYGHQFTRDEDLIKDCIHDVFATINHTRQKLSDTDNIKLYLFKSFRNRFLHYQKKARKMLSEEYLMDGYQFEFTLSVEQKMINSQIDREKLQKLNQGLQQLPPRQKEVIYYLFYEELSIDAIKELMHVTNRRTVQNIVYRALGNLKNVMLMLIPPLFLSNFFPSDTFLKIVSH